MTRDSRDAGPGPRFEIPDLDLPPANPRQSASNLRAVTPPVRSSRPAPEPELVSGEFDLTSELSGSQLSVELDGPISRGGAHAYGADASFDTDLVEPERFELDTEVAVERTAAPNWPTGVTPAREQIALDPKEVRALAGFGDAPTSSLLTPIYALRVTIRQRALLRALRAREAALNAAENARDVLLSELVLTLRPRLEAFDVYREQLKAVLELETRSQQQSSALAETQAEQATELSRLEQTRAQLRSELVAAEQRVAAQAEALESSEHDAARADARHKRVFIELRALEATPNAPRALELSEQAQLLAKELEEKRAALAARRAEHDAAHADQESLTRRLEELARNQQRTAQRYRKPLAQREAGAKSADAERVKALAEIGRVLLAGGKGFDIAPPSVAALRAADEAVSTELRRAESHLRALDLCDRDKVRTGFALLATIAAAFVAYIAYRSFA